jgi:cobalt/nickel transport system permease protein
MQWALIGLLALLVLLVPFGLLAPGSAEFEWGAEELSELVGYLPAGFGTLGALWQLAPLPDYQLPWLGEEGGFLGQAVGYILSAAVGIGLIFIVTILGRMAFARRSTRQVPKLRGG